MLNPYLADISRNFFSYIMHSSLVWANMIISFQVFKYGIDKTVKLVEEQDYSFLSCYTLYS